ncbi:hypothetical protein BC829DRAFT_246754 [Chytridium lagenaria]|nr:hypothetical protein BC829DRAFT_246754 [Chytridium lagenaria]
MITYPSTFYYALTMYRHRTAHPSKPGTMITVDFWVRHCWSGAVSIHAFILLYLSSLLHPLLRHDSQDYLQNLDNWYEELVNHRGLGVPVVVVANKVDMDPSRAKKSFGFVERRREERGGGEDTVPFFLCSASDGTMSCLPLGRL